MFRKIQLFILFIFCFCPSFAKLGNEFTNVPDDVIEVYNQAAANPFDTSMQKYFENLYKRGEKEDNFQLKIIALHALSTIYYAEEKIEKMEKVSKEMEELCIEHEMWTTYYAGIYMQCQLLCILNRNTEAQIVARRAVSYLEKTKSKKNHIYAYGALATVYKSKGNYSQAIASNLQALEACNSDKKFEIQKPGFWLQISEAYLDQKKIEEAKFYLAKVDSFLVGFEDMQYRTNSLLMHLDIASELNDKESFVKAFKELKEVSNDFSVLMPDSKMGVLAMEALFENRHDDAVNLANKIDDKQQRLSMLDKVYRHFHDSEESYHNLRELYKLMMAKNDSTLTEDLASMDAEMNNVELRGEAERSEGRQRMIIGTSIIVVLLVIIFFFIIVVHRHRIHLKNTLLLNKQLQEARDEAVHANEVKSAFIQNMTHEFHTPLNAIYGFASVLKEDFKNLDQDSIQEMLGVICNSSMELNQLINNTITISRYDSQSHPEDVKEIDLDKIIANALENHPIMPECNVKVEYKNCIPKDSILVSSESAINDIVQNVVSNAVKFTTEGSINITAEKEDSNIVLKVKDTGIGISEKDAERIFDRFVKLDEFAPGTGLGLSVSLMAAKSIGATLEVNTKVANGVEFILTLPLNGLK